MSPSQGETIASSPPSRPDPDLLLALEPEELAAKLLFLVRQRQDGVHPATLAHELGGDPSRGQPGYPQHRLKEIRDALTEASVWFRLGGSGRWYEWAKRLASFKPSGTPHGE